MIYLRPIICGGAAVLDTRLVDQVRADLAGLYLERLLTSGVVRGGPRSVGTLARASTSTAITTISNCLKIQLLLNINQILQLPTKVFKL